MADSVWYWNYYDQIVDEEKWLPENQETSLFEITEFMQQSLQWPYFTLYNCYWAGYELYTPIDEQEQPVLPWNIDENGETKTLSMLEQVFQNLLFNIGY